MMISHETPQQALGKSFNDQIMGMFSDTVKNDPVNSDFIRNLMMTLSGTVRSMAFVRDVHVQYLDFNSDRLTRRRQNVEQIANFASFTGSGGFAKIGSFIGAGSLIDFLAKLHYPQSDLPLFALAGVIGAFLVTLAVRVYVSQTDDTWTKSITDDQNKYWREHFKKDMETELFNLWLGIKELVQRFYPDAVADIQARDPCLRMSELEVREIISKRILPPDSLSWPPFILTPQTGQSAPSSTSSPSPGKTKTTGAGTTSADSSSSSKS